MKKLFQKFKAQKTHTKVFLLVFSGLFTLLLIASVVLWTVLASFEATRPEAVAEKVFEQYFKSYDFAGFLKAADREYRALDSAESINTLIKDYYGGRDLELIQVVSDNENSEKYAIVLDNRQIAYFVLTEGSKTAAYGFKYYELTDGEINCPLYKSVTVQVPTGYTVKLNGNLIDKAFITESGIKHKSCEYVLAPAQGILCEKYVVKGILDDVSVSVFAADGGEVSVEYDTADGIYKADAQNDVVLMREFEDYCLDAARAYAKYMTNDGSFSKLSYYLDKEKPIYTRIKGVDLNWVPKHTGNQLLNESVSSFYRYSDEIFSCRVTLTAVLSRPDYSDHKENIDVIFYLVKSGDRYLIYDIVTNS